MKQTAVEWLYNNLKSHFEHDGDLLEVVQFGFKQAKEMENKQQGYSEEEVLELLVKAMKDYKVKQLSFFDNGISNPIYTNLNKWFKEFKKK